MHAIVMAMLEDAMESAGSRDAQKAEASEMAAQVASTLWREMPHEWIAFVASILNFNMAKKALVGAPPVIKNESLLTVRNFFDTDAEAEKFLGRRAAYALHLFSQTCSGDERLVEHEYGLTLFHLQAHQDSLAKADMSLGTKEEWVLFWSALLQGVDDVLQESPMQGLGGEGSVFSYMLICCGGVGQHPHSILTTTTPRTHHFPIHNAYHRTSAFGFQVCVDNLGCPP